MPRTRYGLCLALSVLSALPAVAQEEPSAEAIAVRAASPGVVRNEETGDYTAIELELQGCRLVQTLLTNQGYQQGGPVGVQVLRMDLRDLDPVTGILPAEDTLNGDRRVMLMPSQAAWEDIQSAGAAFSQMRMQATERGDQDNPDAMNGARTLRTQAQRRFSADAIQGHYGPVMARTNVLQIRGDRGELVYPLVAPMQVTFSADGAEAALAAINSLRAGPCASDDGIAVAPEAESADDESAASE